MKSSDTDAAAAPDELILLAMGGNLSSIAGPPELTLESALAMFPAAGIAVAARSSWYLSTPVPASDQPLFVNGVVQVTCALSPKALLAELLRIERAFGRERGVANAARTLDLDILAFGERITQDPALTLPHPRMAERLFVLAPLAEILPNWRHPTLDRRASALLSDLRALGGRDRVEPLRKNPQESLRFPSAAYILKGLAKAASFPRRSFPMARVTVEDCVLKVPNRFDLVMLASQRARDLAAGAAMTLDRDNDKNPVVALREIAEDMVDLNQLSNLIVKGLQKVPDVDEPEDEPEGDVAEIMAAATSIVAASVDDEDVTVIDGDEDVAADLIEDSDELA